jgi:hypothetical protein
MNRNALILAVVLLDFVALSVWALAAVGYVGLFQFQLTSPAGIQVLVDLVIALTLVMVWMYQDARARGASFLPFAVLTLTLGSIGPLLYLLVRELSTVRRAVPAAASAR